MRDGRPAGGAPEAAAGFIADLPLSMVITDPRRPGAPIVYVNRAFEEVTGYSARHAVGRNCRFLQGEDTGQPALDTLRAALRDEVACVVDLRNYRADGTPFLNRLMVSPLRDASGTLVAFVGVQCEVVEGQGAERIPADEATAMLHEAQAGVADHLALIAAMIDVQAQGEDAYEAYRALAGRVEALSLLYDEFSHPPAPRHGARAVVCAGGYVGRVAATLGALEGRASTRLNVDADPVPMRVDDAAKLGLIASEALANTFRHAFRGRPDGAEGLVEIRLKALGADRVRLTVSDDGVGLGDAAWPATGGGGARIVRALAAQLGGRFSVASHGAGTTIMFDFAYDLPTAADAGRGRRIVETS